MVVYTIGVGSDVDAALMSDMASSTGGAYFFSTNAGGLLGQFNAIFTQMRNDGMLTKLSEAIPTRPGPGADRHRRCLSAPLAAQLSVLSWPEQTLGMTLTRPNGVKLDSKMKMCCST